MYNYNSVIIVLKVTIMFKVFENNLFLNKLNSNKYFEEGVCILTCLITFLLWLCNFYTGLIFIFILLILLLILFNDSKYMMPLSLSIIFSQHEGFDVNTVPVLSIVFGGVLVIVIVLFIIKNKLNFKNCKSIIPLIWLSISCLIPIFWNNNVSGFQVGLYFMYFAYIGYLIVYIVFAGSLKSNSFRTLCYTMTWLGVLLSLQCVAAIIIQNQDAAQETVSLEWFDLGWGICNEAGIMMLVSIPFVFIRLIKADKLFKVIYNIGIISFMLLGIILTNSRGTYLFGFLELLCFFVISLFCSKKKLAVFLTYLCIGMVAVIFLQLKYGLNEVFKVITQEVYNFSVDSDNDGSFSLSDLLAKAFNDNGRKDLWEYSINIWSKNAINRIWGAGLIPEYYDGNEGRLIVYHSTFYETLACFGIVGVVGLCYHLIQKYFYCMKFEKSVFYIMIIGYGCVDMYGMLDNTYHMYYYMLPLMMIMACVDNYNGEELIL